MAIRKKQDPSEPIIFHRFAIDPTTHPLLHAHLLPLGLGKPRVDYLRNQLEALLRGDFGNAVEGAGPMDESASPKSSNAAEGGVPVDHVIQPGAGTSNYSSGGGSYSYSYIEAAAKGGNSSHMHTFGWCEGPSGLHRLLQAALPGGTG